MQGNALSTVLLLHLYLDIHIRTHSYIFSYLDNFSCLFFIAHLTDSTQESFLVMLLEQEFALALMHAKHVLQSPEPSSWTNILLL